MAKEEKESKESIIGLDAIISELRKIENSENGKIKKVLKERNLMPLSDLIGILYSNLGEAFSTYILSLSKSLETQKSVAIEKEIFQNNIDIALSRWKNLLDDKRKINETLLHEILLYFANNYQINTKNVEALKILNETVNNLGVVYDELKDYYDSNDNQRFNHNNFIKLHSFIGLFSFNLDFLSPSSPISRLKSFYDKKKDVEGDIKNRTFTPENGFLLALFDFINSLLVSSAYMDARIMGEINKENSIILDYKKATEKITKTKKSDGNVEEIEIFDNYYNKFNISKSGDKNVNQMNYERYVDMKKYEHDREMILMNIDALRFKNQRYYLVYEGKLLCNNDSSPRYVNLYNNDELYKKYYGGITRDFLIINGEDYKERIKSFFDKYNNYSFLSDVTRYVYFANQFDVNLADKNIGRDKAIESLRKIIQFKVDLYDIICKIIDYYNDDVIFKLNFLKSANDVEYDAAPNLPCYNL